MTSGHIVIPIFYHVEPTHVRKQQSSFGDAMAKHKQTMEAEINVTKRSQRAQKMDRWNKALTEVANLKGNDVYGRTEFIEEIVKDIHRVLKQKKGKENILGLALDMHMLEKENCYSNPQRLEKRQKLDGLSLKDKRKPQFFRICNPDVL
ncbi:unnamed protein product [Lactuca virosa]|uniref:TIR domain-containing protein n=1 Tax=Lactuca virosa TaxID=75947 RepID=A0AAU9NSI9_9ASTR|nr:unnamed protein product [Lactuca virosa]